MTDDASARFTFERDPANGCLIGPDGCHYDTEADAMYSGVLGLCGCGDPEAVHRLLIDCLRAHVGLGNPVERIEKIVRSNPEIVAEFIGHFLGSKGLTDHGSSVYGAWLTKRGEQVIEVGAAHDG